MTPLDLGCLLFLAFAVGFVVGAYALVLLTDDDH